MGKGNPCSPKLTIISNEAIHPQNSQTFASFQIIQKLACNLTVTQSTDIPSLFLSVSERGTTVEGDDIFLKPDFERVRCSKMGCCGCDNRASANTAGIFAIIQCIVGFCLAINYLSIFERPCTSYTSKGFFCSVLSDQTTTVRALLIVALVLYLIWSISSIILLIGNAQNKAVYVNQWVGLSTLVIMCDFVFPIIIVSTTYRSFIDQIYMDRYGSYGEADLPSYLDKSALSWNYLGLLLTFSRGGLITWCCDIAFTVLVSRRATEITYPPHAAYVYTQVSPTTTAVTSNYPPLYLHHGFVAPQQGYVIQPQAPPYYQTGQFHQPKQINQPQQFFQQQPYSQPDGTNNVGPPPEYSSGQKEPPKF